ncbi:hypothetical protein EG329_001691 [Mollisiaceae sp. DMI_Dod_QoI]|nr:hypothetical protein EG329_001691 [Helotiales sp. DMI_Dod_QoI]
MTTESSPPVYKDIPLALLRTAAFQTGKKDSFTMASSHMTLSHNSIIRGYNGIYQQAPRVQKPSDIRDFIAYCLAWHQLVEGHHYHEEVRYFPAIEKVTGQKGVMDGEVEQHAAFHAGLKSFKDYLSDLKTPEVDFKSKRLLEIMDSFSQPLYTHLAAEPQALLALSRFASPDRQFDLVKIEREEGKKMVNLDFALNVLPMFLNNMESVEFEGGMWRRDSGVVMWIMKNVLPLWNRRIWRFMSCTSDGRRKTLAV